jgi:uncharacterized membrane protein AbrB (regulator of aidB expression)
MRIDARDLLRISETIPRLTSLSSWVIEMHIGSGFSRQAPREGIQRFVNGDLVLVALLALAGLLASLFAAIYFPGLAPFLAGALSS